MRTMTMLAALAAPLAAQGGAEGYARLLDRALARATAALARKHDVFEDHSSWERAWVARTESFEVRMVRSYAWARNIADGLEFMLGEIRRTLGTDVVPPQPIKVFVFPDLASYNAFGNQFGEHHSSFYGSFYASQHPEQAVAAVEDNDPTRMRMQITHSVVHRYLDIAFPGSPAPAWVHEGLASYFATYWDYEWTIDQLVALRGRHEYVHVPELLADSVQAFSSATAQRFVELGALFYYLLRYREDTRTTLPDEAEQRGPFRDYLLALLRGQDVQALPAHEVIRDRQALDEAFAAYEFPR